MRWFKKHLWNVGIARIGMLFLLACLASLTVSAVSVHAGTLGVATPRTVTAQATPTIDATVIALSKEQLQHENDWWWNYGATILTSLISTSTLAAAGIFAIVRYFNDRRDAREKQEAEAKRLAEDRQAEREKRAEERFQATIEGLSSEKEGAKIGAVILLRTFLRPDYEQFYSQVFDLAVAHLRLRKTSSLPENSNISLPLTPLSLVLIDIFKEAFPRVRNQEERSPQSLHTVGIQLDNAYLSGSDLKRIWMPSSSLRNAYLNGTDLSGARLIDADFSGAELRKSNLGGTDFRRGILHHANLSGANLSGANLSGANLEDAFSLKNTNLHNVTGLTKEQLVICKAKGAIVDEDSTTSISQSIIIFSLSQSNDAQASSAPSVQESTSPPDPDVSNKASSQQEPES